MQQTRTVNISTPNKDIVLGPGNFTVIAGPCSLENEEQFRTIASEVQKMGASALRGGIYKLRTNPEAFQGLGTDGYALAKKIRQETGMAFVSEITDPRQISDLYEFVDVFQVGSRNMYNYELLKEIGRTKKPVMLKRSFSATIDEWILATEYIAQGGNENIMLCERGIRTFERKTRNTFDINAIAYVKARTNFPVLADPSHGTGRADLVIPVSLAAIAAGCDGLLVEVHNDPSLAKSDAEQALTLDAFSELMRAIQPYLKIRGSVG